MTKIFIEVGILKWEQKQRLLDSGLLSEKDFLQRGFHDEYYCNVDNLTCNVDLDKLLFLSKVFKITIEDKFITIKGK